MDLLGWGRRRARRVWGARLLAAVMAVLLAAAPVGAVPSASQDAAPSVPTGLGGTVSWDRAELSWDDSGDPAVIGYQVLRRDRAVQGVGEFSVLVDHTGDAVTAFTDDTVEPERRYVYRVKARSATGLSNWGRGSMPTRPLRRGQRPLSRRGWLALLATTRWYWPGMIRATLRWSAIGCTAATRPCKGSGNSA